MASQKFIEEQQQILRLTPQAEKYAWGPVRSGLQQLLLWVYA